jgi:glycerophosphoryl diester phosphodiesterase
MTGKKKFTKKLIALVVVILLIVSYHILLAYAEHQLERRQFSNVFQDCTKVWSARGLYNQRSEQNSLQSMRRAFEHGAIGAEVDFHFDLELNQFIISHDHPKKDANGKYIYPKKAGKLLTLEHFLAELGKDNYFWLDYKNLDKLNEQQTQQAIARLLKITQLNNMRERLYVEGSNPSILSKYTDAGFKTILAIFPLKQNNLLASLSLNIYKIGFSFYDLTAMAMGYGEVENSKYGNKAQNILGKIPVFMFHVPDDMQTIQSLVNNKLVPVILVGKDLSIDRFNINSCHK